MLVLTLIAKAIPVMANSQFIVSGNLRLNDKYRAFVYVEKDADHNSIKNGRYFWVGTITDSSGAIIAIARCQDAILVNKKPIIDLSMADQNLLKTLDDRAIIFTDGYPCFLQTEDCSKKHNEKQEMQMKNPDALLFTDKKAITEHATLVEPINVKKNRCINTLLV